MNWISVVDQMPDPGKRVLVYHIEYGVLIAYQMLSGLWSYPYTSYGDDDITHWQPLPEDP